MLPFCGYHIGDYFNHWLRMGRTLTEKPRVFSVNCFRRGPKGEFLWAGYGDNMRVLKWIVERVHGRVGARETALGWTARFEDIDWTDCEFRREEFDALTQVDTQAWTQEMASHADWFHALGERVPATLALKRQLLEQRVATP